MNRNGELTTEGRMEKGRLRDRFERRGFRREGPWVRGKIYLGGGPGKDLKKGRGTRRSYVGNGTFAKKEGS